MKRILALVLSAIMLLGAVLTEAGAYAVDLQYKKDENKKDTEEVDYSATLAQYLSLEFKTAEEKLATMKLRFEKDGFQLWVDELTGEVATVNVESGQILFSNPYDIGASYASGKGPSDSTKKKLLSQVMVKYTDNDTEKEMWSFEEAAMRGQIVIKNIKNGIRVEYSIGREETRMLVPKLIRQDRFEELLLDVFAKEVNEISAAEGKPVINWRDYSEISKRQHAIRDTGNTLWFNFNQFYAYYQLKGTDFCATQRERISLYAAYPICRRMNVYVFATDATQTEMLRVENYIKTYIPSYTYETMEQDHNITEYEGSDKQPPLFKLSLEYTLDEWGMSVRLPANGLRFTESLYKLNYISPLPYMGCAGNYLLGNPNEKFTGYNFFPDGSGTIFRHEDLAGGATTTINAKVYGMDFAYNEIAGSHTEAVRYPVFGIITNYHEYHTEEEEVVVEEAVVDQATGEVISEAVTEIVSKDVPYYEDRGFMAIIEEGDALAEISTYHAGALSKYNAMSMLFYPRPKDSYNLANAISVGANASWTVVSKRKFVGNYKIRYIMLTDQNIAKDKGLDTKEGYRNYEVSWMGMAAAYRDYLYATGGLSELKSEDIQENIPAYIETFGAMKTVKKILSMPVNVMTPLTSFENVRTMYDELSAEGVTNIKFKLTGFANGGMFSTVPYKLKWEKAVGGSSGYKDLVAYSEEKRFEVFPDFDFAYVAASSNKMFDGLTFKKHIVKSINNTYMSKRYYSATRQTMIGRFELAISPAYYSHFIEKLTDNLTKFYGEGQTSTISIASLGYALNSDFDEKEPYNREDSKKQTIEALQSISGSFDDVMTESGNAYSWSYVDYITNLPLDSSRYNKSGASVPFIGVVLHGSVQFSGSALNMEGNIGYSLMKAIENGAGLYFILCYQNYAELKENVTLSQYYSVRYDILKEDIIKYYNIVNDLTKDLQLSKIVGHEFLIGERVPDEDEIQADLEAAEQAAQKLADQLAAQEEKARVESLLNGRVFSESTATLSFEKIKECLDNAKGYEEGNLTISETGYTTLTVGMKSLINSFDQFRADKTAAEEVNDQKEHDNLIKTALLETWTEARVPFKTFISTGNNSTYASINNSYVSALNNYNKQKDNAEAKLAELNDSIDTVIASKIRSIPTMLGQYDSAKAALEAITAEEKSAYDGARSAAVAATNALADALTAANKDGALDAVIAKVKACAADPESFSAEFKAAATDANTALRSVENSDAKTAATTAVSDLTAAATALAPTETLYSNAHSTEAELLKYAGSVADARAYAEFSGAAESATAAYEAYLKSVKDGPTYIAAKAEYDAAKAEYDAALAADKELIDKYDAINAGTGTGTAAEAEEAAKYQAVKEAYEAAVKAVDALKTKYSQIIATASSSRENRTTPGSREYELATAAIEEAEQNLRDLEANPPAELVSAKAAYDAYYPNSAEKGNKVTELQDKLSAIEKAYKDDMEATADYATLSGAKDAADAKISTYVDKFTANSPVWSALKAYEDACSAKLAATRAQSAETDAVYDDAEYIRLKNVADNAAAALQKVYDEINAGKENNADYKTLVANVESSLAELETYTLGYKTEEKYLKLEAKLNEADAELAAITDTYKNGSEYKNLAKAVEDAEKAYDTAFANVTAKAVENSDLSDALVNALDAATEKLAEARFKLAEYEDAQVAAYSSTQEYKDALNVQKKAKSAVDSYIAEYIASLDQAYEATKDMKAEDKPEETVGYKYHAASEAYNSAVLLLEYFNGEKSVPSTNKTAKVWTNVIKADSRYTAAKSVSDKATGDVSAYISTFSATAKSGDAYKQATADVSATTTAITEASTPIRLIDSGLMTKAAAYYNTALTTLTSAEIALANAKKVCDISELKEGYEKNYAVCDKVEQRLARAEEEAATAATEYQAAAAAYKDATTKLDNASKELRLQINRVVSNVKTENTLVDAVIKADKDAAYALEFFKDNPDYPDSLKTDVAERQKIVAQLAEEVKGLSRQTLESARAAVKLVEDTNYLPDTVAAAYKQITDPYDEGETVVPDTDGETEEEGYQYTKYTDTSGNIVRVSYDNGVFFILNYNYFAVTTVYGTETYELPAYGGVRVNADGTATVFTTTEIE